MEMEVVMVEDTGTGAVDLATCVVLLHVVNSKVIAKLKENTNIALCTLSLPSIGKWVSNKVARETEKKERRW